MFWIVKKLILGRFWDPTWPPNKSNFCLEFGALWPLGKILGLLGAVMVSPDSRAGLGGIWHSEAPFPLFAFVFDGKGLLVEVSKYFLCNVGDVFTLYAEREVWEVVIRLILHMTSRSNLSRPSLDSWSPGRIFGRGSLHKHSGLWSSFHIALKEET